MRRLIRYIKRCYRWCKFLWVNGIEEWSHCYLLNVFSFAVTQQANEIENNNRHVDCERDVKNMRIVAELLSRMSREDYDELGLSKRLDALPDRRGEEAQAIFKKLREYEEEMWDQDMKLFCQIFSKNIRKWWD